MLLTGQSARWVAKCEGQRASGHMGSWLVVLKGTIADIDILNSACWQSKEATGHAWIEERAQHSSGEVRYFDVALILFELLYSFNLGRRTHTSGSGTE
jgi:hypothetical protein